jgi:hypothetical protein
VTITGTNFTGTTSVNFGSAGGHHRSLSTARPRSPQRPRPAAAPWTSR